MSLETSLDITVLIFSILIFAALVALVVYVIVYREYEFNRIWRSRLFLLTLVILFTITLSLSNLHWLPRQITSEKGRAVTCGFLSFLNHCFLFPLFVATLMGFLRAVNDSSALLSLHPNRGVIARALQYSLPIIVLGTVNIFIAAFASNISFFSTYSEESGCCVESSYFSILGAGFSAVMFAMLLPVTGLFCAGNEAERPRLNVTHSARVRALPFYLIGFILVHVISIFEPYASDTALRVLKYLTSVAMLVFVFVYLYYFIFAPLREASVFPLMRGTLTMRHGEFTDASRDEELAEQSVEFVNTAP
jgi:hypothetical protein